MQTQFLISINNPILRNHKVYGQEILPGLAYIDMLFQLFRELGYDYKKLELRNLTIYNPLTVSKDYDILLTISYIQDQKGNWKIKVEGEEQQQGKITSPKKQYITAEMHQINPVQFKEQIDIKAVEQTKNTLELEDVYRRFRAQDLIHTGFIKAEGTIYNTDTARIINISIGEEAMPSSQEFMFHPTLIDGCAVGSMDVFNFVTAGEERLYIPLFYESFKAAELFNKQCITRVQTSSVRGQHDLLYMTIEFFSMEGTKIAEMKNFATKLVREQGLINRSRKTEEQKPGINQNAKTAEAQVYSTEDSALAEDFLRSILGERLNTPANQINIEAGYYEMGLDSPGLLEIVQAIEGKIGTSLSPTLLFEYTTISALAEYLSQAYADKFGSEKLEADNTRQEGTAQIYAIEPEEFEIPESDYTNEAQEDIAVIGLSCRYPKAGNPQEFWQNLVDGSDLITEIPENRWDWRKLDSIKSPSGKKMSRWGGFIDNHDCFDPHFFRISPREAEQIDPQERLFLEVCWEAIEDAGYTPNTLVNPKGPNKRRHVGVFAGIMHKDYTLIQAEAVAKGEAFVLSLNCAQIANRVSYFCNFHGPSMAVDTVCSSSLTAVHLALESIKRGECEVALAGAVNLSLYPIKYISVGMIDMHSSDGHCHTFGKGGDGYVSGEGIGAILLKPLSKAIKDKDNIYAVIKGSTINHVGTVSGITVPSPVAQGEMIADCLKKTSINPRTISYMEAHGTGTSLGDPIEIQGLTRAYSQFTKDVQFCSIGSVKSNFGHAESAAGISGLHKVILQLHHKTLVPSLHSEEVNPLLNLEQSPFYIQHKTEAWKQPVIIENGQEVVYPRRAAISSFGATGSNGHVILEEYIPNEDIAADIVKQKSQGKTAIVPLSAKNGERLQAYAERLLAFLKENTNSKSPKESKANIRRRLQAIIEAKLTSILAEVLNVEAAAIETDTKWNAYGIEPVQLMQFNNKLKKELSVELDISQLNQASSVKATAQGIISNNSEALEKLYDMTASDTQADNLKYTNKKEINLEDLAYTLQIGREAMEERIAFIAKDIPDLISKLEAYLKEEASSDCYKGHIKRNKETIDLFGSDKDAAELISKWIAKGNMKKIAELWSKGYSIDWKLFYTGIKPRRISLPTYPFAMEHYWVPEVTDAAGINQEAAVLHPLLHKNTSDFYEQRYTSIFNGREFFLSDHIVKGQRILPGVAYIEMARSAAAQALGIEGENQLKLKNITWIRPIVVGEEPFEVHIGLYPEQNGEIAFEIYTMDQKDEAIVYCQGSAVQIPKADSRTLDIKAIEHQCSSNVLTADKCYEVFKQVGLEYGTAHRGIERLYIGQDQALVKLALPYSILQTMDQYVLHPSLMDSALQGTIGFGTDFTNIKSSLPFELQEVQIFDRCTANMWAYVRYSQGSGDTDRIQRFDIDLCSQDGAVCVSLRGFSTRAAEGMPQAGSIKAVENEGTLKPLVGELLMTPVWDKVPLAKGEAIVKEEKVVIIGGTQVNINEIKRCYPSAHNLSIAANSSVDEIEGILKEYDSIHHIIWIAPYKPLTNIGDSSIVEEQNEGLYQILRIAQAVMKLGYNSKKLSWTIITTQAQPVLESDLVNPTHAAVHGLAGSMAKECSNWRVKVVDMQADRAWDSKEILEIPYDRKAHAWVKRDNQWYKRQLLTISNSYKENTAYRKGGVYVVIGGAGDIGQVWTEYMIKNYQAQIIWIGRRPIDSQIQAKIDKLTVQGAAPQYISADAANPQALQKAYEEIKRQHKQIHGLVHAALLLKDQIIAEVEEEKFRPVLASKVDTCVSLAKVFNKENMDFILFFSSIISFIKNPGQSNYAAGCTFKDSFAHQLSKEWSCKVKIMNWGFWYKEESASPETYQIYLRLTEIGMGAIQPPEAMEALELLLSGPMKQIALMKTTKQLMIEGLNTAEQISIDRYGKITRLSRQSSRETEKPKQQAVIMPKAKDAAVAVKKTSVPKTTGVTQELIKEKTTAYIKQIVGEILKIQSSKIDSSEPLERYGIDSIVIIQLTNSLRRVMDNINSTLFFEYQTIDALAEHFVKTRKDALIEVLGLKEEQNNIIEDAIEVEAEAPAVIQPVQSNLNTRRSKRFIQSQEHSGHTADIKTSKIQDIAIIGLSGRYAKADNVKEFWKNLKNGINCIDEVPADRWDWRDYYNEEKGRIGSTYTKWGGFIRDIDKFDPLFFQISPKEAAAMDPQERLFLEAVYESIEDAGYTPSSLCGSRKIGVFAGVMYGQYPTGAKYWSIANRISYLFNFQGPSMSIDTACSSSLTAVHLAIESLYSGISECAIAGGVNLIVSPEHFIGLSEMTMLSPGNQCKAFGEKADGFVDGEGVGAIILKPLQKAIQDGDHVYGVIKGSMLNTAGKTNGYTVPNPTVQYQLVKEALERANINARTISYIEAHGTGTALGDPIEISGLTKAFEHYTDEKQFCAIGSAKTNIGHCESAAGIAAITKVLMQLKHGQIAPSLHSRTKNPNIDFENTPFNVQQELGEWKRPVIEAAGTAKEYPRTAGISSFGAGGSNAHLIIQEYTAEDTHKINVNASNPAIIVLSARNEERLAVKAKELLNAIEEDRLEDASLAAIAYTLQVGREAMEERIAMPVASIKELREKLTSYIEGQKNISDFYIGHVKGNKDMLSVFSSDDDMSATVDTWISKGKYSKLLELWVKGMSFDWTKLYDGVRPQRISLPTYPFARERYWIEDERLKLSKSGDVQKASSPAVIHPLLHENTSDLSEQRYSSVFTGQEFFLTDHIINGQYMLPGVVYLEMARAAAVQALGSSTAEAIGKGAMGLQLKNAVWSKPIISANKPVKINIGIIPEDNGELGYEIYSNDNNSIEPAVHGQGKIIMTLDTNAPAYNIEQLKEQCSQGILTASQCYGAFKTIGIEYGSAHMALEEIYMGSGQVLARLKLPAKVLSTHKDYVLHPSIMDSALQASIGLMIGSGSIKPALPFALQHMSIYSSCTAEMWAFVRYSEGSDGEDKVQRFDIDVMDDAGAVAASLRKFSIRVMEGTADDSGRAHKVYDSLLLEPNWKQEAVIPSVKEPVYENKLIFLCELNNISKAAVETSLKAECIELQAESDNMAVSYQAYALQILEKLQKLLNNKPKNNVLVQVVTASEGKQQLYAGLNGLLKTARLENPRLTGQLIEISGKETAEELTEVLKENQFCPFNKHIKYIDSKRHIAVWQEVEVSDSSYNIPWKSNGIYLITGGTGSLGMMFANEIINKTEAVSLILTGRSPINDTISQNIQSLESLGARVKYIQADVGSKAAVDELFKAIMKDYGTLNGIIHTAGFIRDSFIIKKTGRELMEVIAPKVNGLINLDNASRELDLDFLVTFSSVAGAVGNPGQSDYSTANAFMDIYSKYRNTLVEKGQRKGQTLSINWPLWKEGGIHVDEETEKTMLSIMGTIAMKTSTGINAFYKALSSQKPQVMVMEGLTEKFKEVISEKKPEIEEIAVKDTENNEAFQSNLLKEKATEYFKKLLSSVIGLPSNRIEADALMEKYGIDSIMVMKMTNELEKVFGSLSKTLFFEYQTIEEITGYFLKDYIEQLKELLGIKEQPAQPKISNNAVNLSNADISSAFGEAAKPAQCIRKKQRFANKPYFEPAVSIKATEKSHKEMEIAIIGVSGRYPGAKNINEYWNNLKNGVDSITEIPKERWNHSLYYDEDKTRKGKTYSKWGGFIEGVDLFDTRFFNISPREAEGLDPQERLFLQCVYEALEDSGYTRKSLVKSQAGNVGVYVGSMYTEYQLFGAQETIQGRPMALAGSLASIANRVSYYCNFHGPSIAVDTMCSSSLTTIHLACQALQSGECEAAIAGGVNVSIHPNKYLLLAQGNFASSKGRCESFGLGGDGYVPGEGVGAVILKPLSKAVEDRDQIYGVIKASALNHGGKTNGYTVPNPNAQAEVISKAIKAAGINPRIISYIEAHGTGTSLGDPIEIAGLSKAFGEYTKDKQFCAIGSAKSNIGHCEGAAGIAGVTKILLQLKHRQLAPSLHSKTLNPNIDFGSTPFAVQQELAEWKRSTANIDGSTKEYPRTAGISAFGAGGANAHIIIQEYIPSHDEQRPIITIDKQNPAIIILSAKNEERLKEQAQQLLDAVTEKHYMEKNLADMAYTLQTGREALDERLAMKVYSLEEMEQKLKAYIEGHRDIDDLYIGQIKPNKEAMAIFSADEELKEAVEKWIQKRKYSKLMELWVKGLAFDWEKLYENTSNKPYRISMPTYPFARERYWAVDNKSKDTDLNEAAGNRRDKLVKAEAGSNIKIDNPIAMQMQLIEAKPVNVEVKASTEPLKAKKAKPIALTPLSDVRTIEHKESKQRKIILCDLDTSSAIVKADKIHAVTLETVGIKKEKTGIELEVLQNELSASLANALYIKQNEVDPEEKFIDMGLDSITGVEWIQAINKAYGVNISATKVYDYPTLREFAVYLHKELSKKGLKAVTQIGAKDQRELTFEEIMEQLQAGQLGLEEAEELLQKLALAETEQQKEVQEPEQENKPAEKEGIHYSQRTDKAIQQSLTITIEQLQAELTISLAEALYMNVKDVDADEKFIDMGLDSITGVEWIQSINRRYQVNISATKVYDYPTIREFAAYLHRQVGSADIAVPQTEARLQKELTFDEIMNQVQAGKLGIEAAEAMLLRMQNELELEEVSIATEKVSANAEKSISKAHKTVMQQDSMTIEKLQEELTSSLAQALYMNPEEVDADEKFIDMGLDSITGVEWIQAINKRYKVNISATKVYDYPTIKEFAVYLLKELDKR